MRSVERRNRKWLFVGILLGIIRKIEAYWANTIGVVVIIIGEVVVIAFFFETRSSYNYIWMSNGM